MTYDRRNPKNKRRLEIRRKKNEKTTSDNRTQSNRRNLFDRRMSGDRRTSLRFPVLSDFVKPVELSSESSNTQQALPGIITHVSASGLALFSFTPVQLGTQLFMTLNLPGVDNVKIIGMAVRVEQKGESYLAGIKFIKIPHMAKTQINRIANDFNDCELKLSFGIQDVCTRSCSYFLLCEKPQKIKH